MRLVGDYRLYENIQEDFLSTVYRARGPVGEELLIRMLKPSILSSAELAQLRYASKIARKLESSGVIAPLGFFEAEGTSCIVSENFDGFSLANEGGGSSTPVASFLGYAKQLARTLGEIHRANIVHNLLNFDSIYFNSSRGEAKITHFATQGITDLVLEMITDPAVVRRLLPYISPEQTGRMNREVDYRSDLYSLGVVFYELLTGEPPFMSTDPLEIFHGHMARRPMPAGELNENVPEPLSDIIGKLLKKNSNERYQNGFGLLHDLEYFERQWKEQTLSVFPLGTKDISTKFVLPRTLIGREAEIKDITDTFYRVCGGRSGALIVKGYAGVGKTSIVREFSKHVVEQRGYFLNGSFDRLERDTQHNALMQILRHFAQYMLCQPPGAIYHWKNKVENALGDKVQLILDLLPEYEPLLDCPTPGLTPKVKGAEETINRLGSTLAQFVKLLASKEHPLVIVFDNVQWADYASLRFMRNMIVDLDAKYILWILSYRENEIDRVHPLRKIVDEIGKTRTALKEIEIPPLTLEQTTTYAKEVLHCSRERVAPLSELLFRKTGGNPFFLGQFLLRLYENEYFQMVSEEGWTWSLDHISLTNIADNVVDLLMDKIEGLDEGIQNMLHIAACIGIRFRPTTLAIIMEQGIDDILEGLAQAAEDGFVSQAKNEYYFVHDRVHEAAYTFIGESTRLRTHYRIGILLWAPTPPDELERAVFEIVNQLNLGQKFIQNTDERIEVAKLNLMAGKKAKNAALFSSALKYLEAGIELIHNQRWSSHYDLQIALHELAVETSYLSKEPRKMVDFARVVVERAKTPMEKMKTFELLIQSAHADLRSKDALEYALLALEELGVSFPKRFLKFNALYRFQKMRRKLDRMTAEQLLSLPKVKDPTKQAVLRIMNRMAMPAYFGSPYLWLILVCTQLEYTLEHGLAAESAPVLSSFASVYSVVFEKADAGFHYGRLSLELADKIGDEEGKAHTQMNFYSMIQHWNRHIAYDLDGIVEAGIKSADMGAFHISASLTSVWETHCILAGRELGSLENDLKESGHRIASMGQNAHIISNLASKQFVHNLVHKQDNPSQMTGFYYDVEEMTKLLTETGNRLGSSVSNSFRILLACLFGDFEAAVHHGEVLEKNRDAARALHISAVAVFYSAIARLKVAAGLPRGTKRKRLIRRGQQALKRLRKWNQHASENYGHRVLLIEAELLLLRGDYSAALVSYEGAIQAALENGYIHEAGMANEYAADALLSEGYANLAKVFSRQARVCFRKWGALAKVAVLEEKHKSLLAKELEASTQTTFKQIDYMVVVQALQEISTEIEISRLLEKVIRTLSSVSGANKVQLFMFRDDELYLEAEQSLADRESISVGSKNLPMERDVFLSVINYVWRAKEPVVLDNATHSPNYRNDPYVLSKRIRSVLCLPVKRQEDLLGIIYLENNVADGAFTPERIEALELLASQAAISVENARLYDDVLDSEQTARELSRSIALANDELEKSLEMLEESEKRLSIVLSGANLGMWDYNTVSNEVVFNERFAYMHDLSRDETILPIAKLLEHIHPDDVTKPREFLAAELKDSVRQFDFEYRARSGQGWRWVFCRGQVSRRDENKQPLRVSGILLDIDPRKKAEERRGQLQKQVLQQQKIESIGQLTGGIAHDLNNLITPILGYADLIKEDLAADPLLLEEIDEIRYAGRKARDLIKQLLAFGRKQVLKWKIVDINDVILEFESVLNGVVREDVELEIALIGRRTQIKADPAQLQQILLNLVVNARDALPDGGGIRIETGFEELELKSTMTQGRPLPGKYVVLRVSDTGHGMDEDTRKRVFEPFFSTKEVGKGTGLGLSTVYGIIKQHGGHIEVQSAFNGGTLFTMCFPIMENLEQMTGDTSTASHSDEGRPTVLIVEDEMPIRRLVASILRKRGYNTLVASGGEDALAIAFDHGEKIDLLLTDVVMPKMNGREVFERVHLAHPETKVLYMSGYAVEGFWPKGQGDQEMGMINKPFTPDLLERKVREALEGPP